MTILGICLKILQQKVGRQNECGIALVIIDVNDGYIGFIVLSTLDCVYTFSNKEKKKCSVVLLMGMFYNCY